MQCRYCRAWNEEDERRCVRCGRRMVAAPRIVTESAGFAEHGCHGSCAGTGAGAGARASARTRRLNPLHGHRRNHLYFETRPGALR